MAGTRHFICKVTDSINDHDIVASRYCDVHTKEEAIQHFLAEKEITKYIGDFRYQIVMRENATVIQDYK